MLWAVPKYFKRSTSNLRLGNNEVGSYNAAMEELLCPACEEQAHPLTPPPNPRTKNHKGVQNFAESGETRIGTGGGGRRIELDFRLGVCSLAGPAGLLAGWPAALYKASEQGGFSVGQAEPSARPIGQDLGPFSSSKLSLGGGKRVGSMGHECNPFG